MDSNEYGLARLNLIPVRNKPDDRSEMVTQVLFGDTYLVLDKTPDSNWIRIKIIYDEYEGWINAKQHHSISEEFFLELSQNDYRISTEITSTILYQKKPLTIVIGSILPISTNEIFDAAEQFAFNGESKSLNQKRDPDFILQIASNYLNVPYLWGGKSPFGIDCSGFTQMVFKIAGYPLKRDAFQQEKQGTEVKDPSKIMQGDLAFFSSKNNKVTHVGIVMDKNKIIHSSGCVRIDNFDEKGIFNEIIGKHTHKFHSVKRIVR